MLFVLSGQKVSADHALTAYELNARQYFVKPLNQQRVFTVLEQVLRSRREYIFIRSRRALRKIMCREILYCGTQGKYQIIHTRTEEIPARMSARSIKILVPLPSQSIYRLSFCVSGQP